MALLHDPVPTHERLRQQSPPPSMYIEGSAGITGLEALGEDDESVAAKKFMDDRIAQIWHRTGGAAVSIEVAADAEPCRPTNET